LNKEIVPQEISSDKMKTHHFSPAKVFILLIVSGLVLFGCTKDDDPPASYFTANQIAAIEGEPVAFVDLSLHLPTSWLWDFGDNITSTDQKPYHIYSNPGLYTVSLTVEIDGGSNTHLENELITVHPVGGEPCPEQSTVTWHGQTYNTVLIGRQCWLKENLNVGEMIDSLQNQSDNGILEKYCINNDPAYCEAYGGLYQWDEMMQYTLDHGAQGICPTNWHIPTDVEWNELHGAIDSLFSIKDEAFTKWGLNGYNAGLKLKSDHGWNNGNNGNDPYGFAALPAGYTWFDKFLPLGYSARFYSTGYSIQFGITYPHYRDIKFSTDRIRNGGTDRRNAHSVRCIRDE